VDSDSNASGDHSFQLAIAMVTAHVRACPDAADTIKGISRWWLGANAVSIPPDALERALRHLAKAGVLGTRVLPSGELLWYVLNAPTPDSAAEN
jgi:hypothetical protein